MSAWFDGNLHRYRCNHYFRTDIHGNRCYFTPILADHLEQVVWAMCTRCHPPDDIDILRNTWSTYLDPTRNPPEIMPYGAKTLINADSYIQSEL